jgi:hypothetical protein
MAKRKQVTLLVKQKSRAQNNGKRATFQSRNQTQRTVFEVPVARGITYRTGRPKFLGTGENQLIEHEETIGNLYAPATNPGIFQVSTPIRINPGLQAIFPWLSGVAAQFESYVFEYLHFAVETSSGSSSDGSIHMAVDFDSADAAPTTKVQLMAIEHAVRGVPWKSFTYVAPKNCLHKRKTYFVRTNTSLPDLGELNLSDVGVLHMATDGLSTASKLIGELKVKYRIRLMTPQLSSVSSTVQLQYTNPGLPWATMIQTPFGAPSITKVKSSNWDEYVEASDSAGFETKLKFKKAGNYALQWDIGGDNAACTVSKMAPVTSSPGTTVSQLYSFPYPGLSEPGTDAAFEIKVTDPKDAWATFKTLVVAGGATVMQGIGNVMLSYANSALPSIFSVPEPPIEGRFVDHRKLKQEWAERFLKQREDEQRQTEQFEHVPHFQHSVDSQQGSSYEQSESLLRKSDPKSFPSFVDVQRVYSKNPSPQIR